MQSGNQSGSMISHSKPNQGEKEMKFRLKRGRHSVRDVESGVVNKYKPGAVIESEQDLAAKFPMKFEKVEKEEKISKADSTQGIRNKEAIINQEKERQKFLDEEEKLKAEVKEEKARSAKKNENDEDLDDSDEDEASDASESDEDGDDSDVDDDEDNESDTDDEDDIGDSDEDSEDDEDEDSDEDEDADDADDEDEVTLAMKHRGGGRWIVVKVVDGEETDERVHEGFLKRAAANKLVKAGV